jgi:hypothetical protein
VARGGVPFDLEFVGDGRRLFASSTRESALWDLDGHDLLRRARELAGRNLTRTEWSEEFGQRQYEKVFPEYP